MKEITNSFENENLYFGFYVIDKEHQTVEIEGDSCLKKLLFEASTLINAKWTPKQPEAPGEVDGETPAGTKCFLPKITLGGIPAMTVRNLKLYWTVVMRKVLDKSSDQLGYDTHK